MFFFKTVKAVSWCHQPSPYTVEVQVARSLTPRSKRKRKSSNVDVPGILRVRPRGFRESWHFQDFFRMERM